MSYTPLAGCLVACLLTLAPAVTTRAQDDGISARRKAEIDALIVRKRAEKEKRTKVAAIRNAERARQLSEARAHEINLAQVFTAYQMSLARQSMMQEYWLTLAALRTSPQGYYPGAAGTVTVEQVIPVYTSGSVFVKVNSPGPAPCACQGSSGHSGGPVGGEHTTHATHSETVSHHGHAR
jgi:hypothetical protein